MRLIGVTLRTSQAIDYPETRDALDQRWYPFLKQCKLLPIMLPNHLESVTALLNKIPLDGILLTGGNDSSERHLVEDYLINHAIQHQLPLLGVCHGMQAIQRYYNIALHQVDGHIEATQQIEMNGEHITVNSYHQYGTKITSPELIVFAKANDNVIKAIKHRHHNIIGIMWHPERGQPFHQRDLHLFTELFENTKS